LAPAQQAGHQGGHPAPVVELHEPVDMVGHPAVVVQSVAEAAAVAVEQAEEGAGIIRVPEESLAVVAAGQDAGW
jgi:hypothetical protein